ncbi:unnamed protein product [Amoebophrya sp. A120]|nr:unnamed protein product [Amoebophrya sp. A120]|eukprot:GSA120T00020257001.1
MTAAQHTSDSDSGAPLSWRSAATRSEDDISDISVDTAASSWKTRAQAGLKKFYENNHKRQQELKSRAATASTGGALDPEAHERPIGCVGVEKLVQLIDFGAASDFVGRRRASSFTSASSSSSSSSSSAATFPRLSNAEHEAERNVHHEAQHHQDQRPGSANAQTTQQQLPSFLDYFDVGVTESILSYLDITSLSKCCLVHAGMFSDVARCHQSWKWAILQNYGVYYEDYVDSVSHLRALAQDHVGDEVWRLLFIYIRQVLRNVSCGAKKKNPGCVVREFPGVLRPRGTTARGGPLEVVPDSSAGGDEDEERNGTTSAAEKVTAPKTKKSRKNKYRGSIELSDDGKFVYWENGGELHLIDIVSGTVRKRINLENQTFKTYFHRIANSGKRLFVCLNDRLVYYELEKHETGFDFVGERRKSEDSAGEDELERPEAFDMPTTSIGEAVDALTSGPVSSSRTTSKSSASSRSPSLPDGELLSLRGGGAAISKMGAPPASGSTKPGSSSSSSTSFLNDNMGRPLELLLHRDRLALLESHRCTMWDVNSLQLIAQIFPVRPLAELELEVRADAALPHEMPLAFEIQWIGSQLVTWVRGALVPLEIFSVATGARLARLEQSRLIPAKWLQVDVARVTWLDTESLDYFLIGALDSCGIVSLWDSYYQLLCRFNGCSDFGALQPLDLVLTQDFVAVVDEELSVHFYKCWFHPARDPNCADCKRQRGELPATHVLLPNTGGVNGDEKAAAEGGNDPDPKEVPVTVEPKLCSTALDILQERYIDELEFASVPEGAHKNVDEQQATSTGDCKPPSEVNEAGPKNAFCLPRASGTENKQEILLSSSSSCSGSTTAEQSATEADMELSDVTVSSTTARDAPEVVSRPCVLESQNGAEHQEMLSDVFSAVESGFGSSEESGKEQPEEKRNKGSFGNEPSTTTEQKKAQTSEDQEREDDAATNPPTAAECYYFCLACRQKFDDPRPRSTMRLLPRSLAQRARDDREEQEEDDGLFPWAEPPATFANCSMVEERAEKMPGPWSKRALAGTSTAAVSSYVSVDVPADWAQHIRTLNGAETEEKERKKAAIRAKIAARVRKNAAARGVKKPRDRDERCGFGYLHRAYDPLARARELFEGGEDGFSEDQQESSSDSRGASRLQKAKMLAPAEYRPRPCVSSQLTADRRYNVQNVEFERPNEIWENQACATCVDQPWRQRKACTECDGPAINPPRVDDFNCGPSSSLENRSKIAAALPKDGVGGKRPADPHGKTTSRAERSSGSASGGSDNDDDDDDEARTPGARRPKWKNLLNGTVGPHGGPRGPGATWERALASFLSTAVDEAARRPNGEAGGITCRTCGAQTGTVLNFLPCGCHACCSNCVGRHLLRAPRNCETCGASWYGFAIENGAGGGTASSSAAAEESAPSTSVCNVETGTSTTEMAPCATEAGSSTSSAAASSSSSCSSASSSSPVEGNQSGTTGAPEEKKVETGCASHDGVSVNAEATGTEVDPATAIPSSSSSAGTPPGAVVTPTVPSRAQDCDSARNDGDDPEDDDTDSLVCEENPNGVDAEDPLLAPCRCCGGYCGRTRARHGKSTRNAYDDSEESTLEDFLWPHTRSKNVRKVHEHFVPDVDSYFAAYRRFLNICTFHKSGKESLSVYCTQTLKKQVFLLPAKHAKFEEWVAIRVLNSDLLIYDFRPGALSFDQWLLKKISCGKVSETAAGRQRRRRLCTRFPAA